MKTNAVKCTVKLSGVMCREKRWAWYWDEQDITHKNIQNVQCRPTQGRLMEDYMTQPYKIPKYQQYTNFPKINLKLLDGRKLTCIKFHNKDLQKLCTTVHNLITMTTWYLEFVCPCHIHVSHQVPKQ